MIFINALAWHNLRDSTYFSLDGDFDEPEPIQPETKGEHSSEKTEDWKGGI